MEIQLGQLCIIGLKCITRSRSSIDIVFVEIEPSKCRSAKGKAGSKEPALGDTSGGLNHTRNILIRRVRTSGGWGADNLSPYAAGSLRQRCEFQCG